MGINRVEKLIRELAGLSSLGAAAEMRNQPVVVVIGGRPIERYSDMSEAAICLLLRCFSGEVWLDKGSDGETGPEFSRIVDRARSESLGVSGDDRVRVGKGPLESLRFGIGIALAGEVFIDAAGWTAAVNRLAEGYDAPIAAASCLAAALGVAKAFTARALGRSRAADEAWAFSLWSMSPVETADMGPGRCPESLGKVALLGAGSIGSAIGHVLKKSNVGAEVLILDDDAFDEDNVDTTLLLQRSLAIAGAEKALALSGAMKTEKLRLTHLKERVNGASTVLRERRDFFFCGVDNAETRRELDHVNAAWTINAAVGGTKEDAGHLLVSRHSPEEPRLSSLYPESERKEAPVSSQPVDCSTLAYHGATMAAPFVALAAASIAIGQALRIAAGRRDKPRIIKVDVRGFQQMMEVR